MLNNFFVPLMTCLLGTFDFWVLYIHPLTSVHSRFFLLAQPSNVGFFGQIPWLSVLLDISMPFPLTTRLKLRQKATRNLNPARTLFQLSL